MIYHRNEVEKIKPLANKSIYYSNLYCLGYETGIACCHRVRCRHHSQHHFCHPRAHHHHKRYTVEKLYRGNLIKILSYCMLVVSTTDFETQFTQKSCIIRCISRQWYKCTNYIKHFSIVYYWLIHSKEYKSIIDWNGCNISCKVVAERPYLACNLAQAVNGRFCGDNLPSSLFLKDCHLLQSDLSGSCLTHHATMRTPSINRQYQMGIV